MSKSIQIKAEQKTNTGKGVARAIRREGKVPAIIYGGKNNPLMVSLSTNEFLKEFKKGNIQAKLFEIELDGKIITAIPREIQLDPVKDIPIHADFQEVSKDTLVKVAIHVKIINDDKSPGIKRGGALNVVARTVLVYCHPTNIPDHIVVDVGTLEIGQNLHINDISLPTGLTPVDSTNFPIVSVSGRSAEVEETTAAAATTPEGTPAAPGTSTPAASS
jgi:large subunit ribosomal protein L25